MTESLPNESRVLMQIRRIGFLAALVLGLLGCLAIISTEATNTGLWDGAFPPGEFHLIVKDATDNPVQGTVLDVFEGGTNNFAFEYPIDNYLSPSGLVSNEQGVIIALHKPRGFEFGGSCWRLFWVFPKCSSAPKYDFRISADGYKAIKFSTDILFKPAYEDTEIRTTPFLLENGQAIELPIYEIHFTLEE